MVALKGGCSRREEWHVNRLGEKFGTSGEPVVEDTWTMQVGQALSSSPDPVLLKTEDPGFCQGCESLGILSKWLLCR